ncbi:MAG: putative sulfate/molybdate transporter [Halobacteriales archaeon]
MAYSVRSADRTRLTFGLNEVTGAIGDSITVIPLVVALALLTEISLPHVLLAFGAFQVVWGVRYGLPISVEPMKALAALAIAGALTYAELAVAGLVLGVVLLALGGTGTLHRLEAYIGEPVVRGVQLAVGLVLLETAAGLALGNVPLALAGVAIAGAVALVGYPRASAIAVLAVGAGLAVVTVGVPTPQLPGFPPPIDLAAGLSWGVADGIVAQLAMTIGNAALATSLLFADLLDRDVSPDELSTSMGAMNLAAVPLGGIPMCHGCDGVAGKHAFGARTGGSNVVLGVAYVAVALVASGALVAAFPLAMLGVLLAVVAVSVAAHVRASDHLGLSVGIGLLAVVGNLGVAFVAGVLAYQVLVRRAA